MNIDLLFTRKGEAGLIASQNWVQKAIGVLFDGETGLMSIEFTDMDMMELNIPIDASYNNILDVNQTLNLGSVIDGKIAQAYQVPLLFLNNPYRDHGGDYKSSSGSLLDFEYFIRACTTGQPVHRENLSDETSLGCVLGEACPSTLEFAPHLARRHALEASPKPGLGNIPGLGLGSGGGSVGGGTTGTGQTGSGGKSGDGKSGKTGGKRRDDPDK